MNPRLQKCNINYREKCLTNSVGYKLDTYSEPNAVSECKYRDERSNSDNIQFSVIYNSGSHYPSGLGSRDDI